MMIYFARLPFILTLLLYAILGLLIPDFAQARHAVMLTLGLSFVVLLDAVLAALVARRQAASRQAAARRPPAVFLGDPGHPPADPRLN
jgi:hypothetical protein